MLIKSTKKINKLTDKYLIVCEQTDAMGIDPETASPEQLKQWKKDNPTIISKKSIHNIKTCLSNNCNVTILIKQFEPMLRGYVVISVSYPSGNEYFIQYLDVFGNKFRYLSIRWDNDKFSVSDYKFD